MIALGFALLAMAGTGVRWITSRTLPRPTGTLLVNLVGAFALGLLAKSGGDSNLIVGVGGLGALTTFSTLVDESADLSARPQRGRALAAAYVCVSLAAGVAAAWMGLQLA